MKLGNSVLAVCAVQDFHLIYHPVPAPLPVPLFVVNDDRSRNLSRARVWLNKFLVWSFGGSFASRPRTLVTLATGRSGSARPDDNGWLWHHDRQPPTPLLCCHRQNVKQKKNAHSQEGAIVNYYWRFRFWLPAESRALGPLGWCHGMEDVNSKTCIYIQLHDLYERSNQLVLVVLFYFIELN